MSCLNADPNNGGICLHNTFSYLIVILYFHILKHDNTLATNHVSVPCDGPMVPTHDLSCTPPLFTIAHTQARAALKSNTIFVASFAHAHHNNAPKFSLTPSPFAFNLLRVVNELRLLLLSSVCLSTARTWHVCARFRAPRASLVAPTYIH